MCIECSLGATFSIMLCIKDRKVWKKGHSLQFAGSKCPTCGEPGKDMGFRWRPPRLTNKQAWTRIEAGDYLWELPKNYVGPKTWSGDVLNLAKKKQGSGLKKYPKFMRRRGYVGTY